MVLEKPPLSVEIISVKKPESNSLPPVEELLERALRPLSEPPPDAIPGYQFKGLVGEGGMGRVYRARQDSLDRDVAIKVLRTQSGGPELRARFEAEAKSMALLQHPNIVTVFDFGVTENGDFYLVMELLEGTDLARLIKTVPPEPNEALRIARDLCSALECAHGHGLIHRDIKPSNVLVTTNGQVKLTDFGLSKLFTSGSSHELTRSGTTMGTLDYMSPEQQVGSKELDPRSDLYSFGILLYNLFTGITPKGSWKPPSEIRSAIPSQIDSIIARSIEPAPEDRYQTATELGGDLASAPVKKRKTPGIAATFLIAIAILFAIPAFREKEPLEKTGRYRLLPENTKTVLSHPVLSPGETAEDALETFREKLESAYGAVGEEFAFALSLPADSVEKVLPPLETGFRPEILRLFYEQSSGSFHCLVFFVKDPRDWRIAFFHDTPPDRPEALGLNDENWLVIDHPAKYLDRHFAIWTKGHNRLSASIPTVRRKAEPTARRGFSNLRSVESRTGATRRYYGLSVQYNDHPSENFLRHRVMRRDIPLEEASNSGLKHAAENNRRIISQYFPTDPESEAMVYSHIQIYPGEIPVEQKSLVSNDIRALRDRSLSMMKNGWRLVDIGRIGSAPDIQFSMLWDRDFPK